MPMRSYWLRLPPFFYLCAALLQGGCATDDAPPYYTAQITNVYHEQATVEHFSLLYAWEERGETPFLKQHSLSAREVIVEVLVPLKNDPSHVTVNTERIALENLSSIELALTETGKNMTITTKDGRRILADMSFPKCLKVDPASGFADTKIFATGNSRSDGKASAFKLELNFIKKISIINKTDT
jgi:hypothetical protein